MILQQPPSGALESRYGGAQKGAQAWFAESALGPLGQFMDCFAAFAGVMWEGSAGLGPGIG